MCKILPNFAARLLKQRTITHKDNENRFSIFNHFTDGSDELAVQDIAVMPSGSTALAITLDNTTTNLMGWQCDIELPEGLVLYLKENGKSAATLGNRFVTTEHTIASSRLSNGAYRFIATSMDGEAIPGSGGTLFTAILRADASLTPGTVLTGKVTNREFNTQDNQKVTFDDVTFSVTIADTATDIAKTAAASAQGSATFDLQGRRTAPSRQGQRKDITIVLLPDGTAHKKMGESRK